MMLKHLHLDHQFVRHMPDELGPGMLYISMEYATASHLCCCGCGEEVVTPFAPAQWKMSFDGEAVSLSPSVGNWLQKCRSHYIIRNGKVIEAGSWSDEKVASGLAHDKAARLAMFGQTSSSPLKEAAPVLQSNPKTSFWAKMKAWIG
jgi:hypothetical protein